MSSWYDCVCCGENGEQLIATLKQKQSKREIKQAFLEQKIQTNKPIKSAKKWSKDINIIIIGAGHAGIHMALLLLESGYNNVKILERKDKLGGRLLSIKDKTLHTVDELGTCYIYNNDDELMKLIDTFDKDNELIQINENTELNIIDDNCDEKNVCFGVKDWIHTQSDELCSSKILDWFPSTKVHQVSFANIKLIYTKLYENIFGIDYANNNEITIPPQPASNKMELINMSILDFLCTNGLQSLIPLFVYTLSFNGYGNLNEIPAFYGLWYNKPNTLFIDQTVYILRHGIYSLFENLVKKININIIHNVNLKSIDRHVNDKNKRIEINYCLRENKREIIECDLLFIACDMTAIRTANEEKEIFDNMDTFSLCCTLFECDINYNINQLQESKAIQIWSHKLLKCDSHLYLLRNSSKLILKNDYHKECKRNDLKKEKFVSYQFSNKSRKNGSGEIFKKILLDDLKELNKRNVKILKQRVMRYFPKFTQFGINKYYPWKIQNELQGKHKNTFYIGKSTCFDSIEYELKYNIQLKQRLNL